jgi:hypothetical protein
MLASADAETAIRRLGALIGFYRRSRRTFLDEASPRLRTPGGRGSPGQLRTLYEATIVRAVSIVEAFVLDLGDVRVRQRLLSLDASPSVSPESRAMVTYLLNEKWTTLTPVIGTAWSPHGIKGSESASLISVITMTCESFA